MFKASAIRAMREEAEAKAKIRHLPYIALEKKHRYPADLKTREEKLSFFQEYLLKYQWWAGEGRILSRRRNNPGGGYTLFTPYDDVGDFGFVFGATLGLVLDDIRFDRRTGDMYFIFHDANRLYRSYSPYLLLTLYWDFEFESALEPLSREWFDTWEEHEDDGLSIKESEDHEMKALLGGAVLAAWSESLPECEGVNVFYILFDNTYLFSFVRGDGGARITIDVCKNYQPEELPEMFKRVSAVMVSRRRWFS